ncbi:porphobilinogen synthase [Salicibibacter kimchii]|uniref:Delta-aminolevulinic acid dehydratase n=1 Tax=Salicibibacter kimchii TaxID=2099786 RepID=A0A345BXW7_9BACI|nr:porphobilinogen synthase [Salicibibacter kimchii]AXF55798.1 porphobilinogen synthase [Salicibibacter kimchii]
MSELQFDRNRRMRTTGAIRDLVRETTVKQDDLISPVFAVEGTDVKHEVPSMPGVYQYSLDLLKKEIDDVVEHGIKAILLFGVPGTKDELGSNAYNENGIVQRAIRELKGKHPELMIIADTCLCQFTDHGHCGVIEEGHIVNDRSLDLLVKTAISQAEAGADVIAPSNMMDGFVAAIRSGLDEADFKHIPIMSYAVKYASAYYGPFRDAAHSSPSFGDRRTYQMDPANRNEALREAMSDDREGADFLIVKPALSYLDIVSDVKSAINRPVVAYNVSGEYSMIKAAAAQGWLDEKETVMEKLTSMKRAGADLIVTYFAKDMARWISESDQGGS